VKCDGLQIGNVLRKAGITDKTPFAPPEAFSEITGAVTDICEMREENDAGADLRRTAKIYEILGALMKHSTATGDKNAYVKKAVGIMETDYHENITVEQIAYEIGLDRSYFSTLFKAQTGRTPHTYLTSLRINKACTLLDKGLSVSETAVSVGLDPRNFSRLFRKETGKTPGQYLRRQTEKQ